MDKHVTVLGALFLALGLMGLIGMLVVFLIFSIGSAALGILSIQEPDFPPGLALLPAVFGLFICLMFAVGTIPSLIAAFGLLLRRRWAHVWALIAGIINLPSFPAGTCVGAYAIWVYLQDETRTVLR